MAVLKDEKTGKWYVHIKFRDPVTEKIRWKKKRGFITKREAKQWEAQALNQSTQPTEILFDKIAEEWEQYNQISETQRQKHAANFRIRFADYYHQPLASITKQKLIRWRTQLAENDRYATKTKNDTITFVKGVFAYAHEAYGIENTAEFLKPLKKTDSEIMNNEMEVWTPEEFSRFLSSVDNRTFALFFEFLFWTGCRRGEALGLQKSDIDGEWINIHQSIKHFKNGLKPTKTKQSRKIRLDPVLLEHLQPLLDLPGPFLFGGDQSLSLTQVDKHFREGIEKSGVKKIRLHDLRHSHASWLIASGANIVAVSKRLGHSDVAMTMKIYTHLLQNSDDEMMDIITKNHK